MSPLAQAPAPADVRRQAAAVKADWARGEPPDARAALDRHPELLADKSVVLDLAYEEFFLRTEAGERVDPDAFCDRFPAFRSSLLGQLRGHQIIVANAHLLEQTPLPAWPTPGQRLCGAWTLRREMGRGAFARVFLADEPATDRAVVLKLTDEAGNEARTLGALAHPKHFGLLLHSALALTSAGLPLGLLHVHAWARDPKQRGQRKDRRRKQTAQKESQRWLDTEAACVAALPAGRTVVTIGDREADFYDLFAVRRRAGQHVLIRAKPRRRLAGAKELLGVAVGQQPVAGHITVRIPRKDGRPGRTATLAVRFGSFALAPPCTHPRRTQLAPLPLRAVFVEEVKPPAKAQPVRWLLLTTLPVTSLAEAEQVVRWYAWRWRIEHFHYTLKSGCKVEQLQLETAARLRRALAVYALVAARLLHLTYRARQEPEAVCEPAVSREEWQVLWRHFCPGRPLPLQPPCLHQAVRWIAQLGGFLGRKGDGEPGVKVLWRGLQQLRAMVVGYRLAQAPPPTGHSSNQC